MATTQAVSAPAAQLNTKGITAFLLITFVITYAIEGALALAGFRWEGVPALFAQYVVAGVMWVPALAAVVTVKFITREGLGVLNVRFGPLKPYLIAAVLIPLVFAVVYGLTWLLGLGQPDWELTALREMAAAGGVDPADMPSPAQMIAAIFFSSLIVGPTINGIFGFGEELGWRGFLLPKLMPLGKVRAYLLLGVIWGLWHAPLILLGFNYPGYPLWGVVWMCALTTALGIFINELTLRYQSSILAGSIHGAFNGQGYGIWRQLFPTVNPLLGGITGLVGIAVLAALGLLTARRLQEQQTRG